MIDLRLIADGRPISEGGSRGHVEIFGKNMLDALGPLGRRNMALFGGRLKRRIGLEIRRRARTRTGALEQSWKLSPIRQSGVTLTSDSPYALMREHGGVIRARRKPFLKFKVNNKWVSVRQVKQQGWGYQAAAFAASLSDAEKTFHATATAVVRKAQQRLGPLRDVRTGRFVSARR